MSPLARHWPHWLPQPLRERLEDGYGDPGRGYHDLLHLREVLERVEELLTAEPGQGVDAEAVRLAAWFHDAVYDRAGDLEERSAVLAERELATAGAPGPLVAEVARLVRLTATHDPAPDDGAGQVLCDADLAILAAAPVRYAAYVAGVRREYADVADPDFRAGRARVLRALVERPTLFCTPYARARWEPAARANLAGELARLEG